MSEIVQYPSVFEPTVMKYKNSRAILFIVDRKCITDNTFNLFKNKMPKTRFLMGATLSN